MHPQQWLLAGINVLGGSAVLGSYALGFASHPETRGALWGGVPAGLQPLYNVSMLLATAGYFAFTYFVLFRLDPARVRIGRRFGFGLFHALYLLVLVPSALWMPLTFALLEDPAAPLWGPIRLVLAAVGAGSLGLVVALVRVDPGPHRGARRAAVVGSLCFSFQTAVLDALVWPAFFPA